VLKILWCCVLLVAVGLAACGTGHPTKSADNPIAGTIKDSPDSSVADQRFADAMKLVSDKNWPQAVVALQSIVEDRSFGSLPSDFQYKVLTTASRASIYHGPPKQGYEYLRRVIAMPQAGFRDWLERLREAITQGNEADEVSTLTVLMRQWPERSGELDSDYIQRTADAARQLPHAEALPLLQALYNGHWKLKWDVEPSELWRDLALLLLNKNRFTEANEAAGRVTDVYVLVAMRADRRFDAVVAANPGQFDIGAAAEREFQALQTESEKAPQSLEVKSTRCCISNTMKPRSRRRIRSCWIFVQPIIPTNCSRTTRRSSPVSLICGQPRSNASAVGMKQSLN
jgi:hypothetical protein